MYANHLKTYESVNKTTMSGREIEAAVLTKGAIRLKECQLNWDAEDREEKLMSALKFNQQIWNIFQAEFSDNDNPLPIELRKDLLRLSAFIDKQTFDVMAFPAPEKLVILIKINNNIAAGLRDNQSEALPKPIHTVPETNSDQHAYTFRAVQA